MVLIFGFDIGTTSIGWAVIQYDYDRTRGRILRLGVRIFPEARDPKGVPLNQERRTERLRRRQLRRRRERRLLLADLLHKAGFLPKRGSPEWRETMKSDPYELRKQAFEGGKLSRCEVGRAIYHLAKRRHFRGRDVGEISDDSGPEDDRDNKDVDEDEKKAKTDREATSQALQREKVTLGAWLARRGPHERRRGEHATRQDVEREFDEVFAKRLPSKIREAVHDAIFSQRPTFWRKKTLRICDFVPGAPPCPRGSWLSQQKRMLEKLNNLEIAGGNRRPLDEDERRAILDRLQTQESMSWTEVRKALKPLYAARGEAGRERRLKFNLQHGGEKKLIGNMVEAKLAGIFADDWREHPRKDEIRKSVPERIWQANYQELGDQRVVIRPSAERKQLGEEAARRFAEDFGVSEDRALQLAALKLPAGWEPYSAEALRAMLPRLEEGARFGALLNGPDWEDWRNETFPKRDRPTGNGVDRLPSPADMEEGERIAGLRNPTVARAQNELRKVVNNLIGEYGKPDLIRVELAREVGLSKRRREDMAFGMRQQERRREAARKHLEESSRRDPSPADIEKWLLWEECGRRCPYTGKTICFDALFNTGEFQVEHIWPRSRSLDNGFRNKTLCHADVNAAKGSRTPFEYFGNDPEGWAALKNRLDGMKAPRGGGVGMSPGKIKRFVAESIPEGFVDRQLTDTGYAARETAALLKRLWPDTEPGVRVQEVSGRVTGHLRRLWELNGILSEDGKKTRADHRHHAVDALVVACAHPGMTQRLSRYWQAKDNPKAPEPPRLAKPWETIRADAERAVDEIVVSHRVRRKVSGPLHMQTIYGDTDEDVTGKDGTTYRHFVTRKKVEDLTLSTSAQSKGARVMDIVDEGVKEIVRRWVEDRGGDPKKAFPPYPKRGRKGPKIRKVRLHTERQIGVMARASTGYAKLGNNHHMAIYRLPDGSWDREVVSLLEAARRLAKCQPVVRRDRGDGSTFVMSLASRDTVELQEGEEAGLWVVHGIDSDGRPTLARINDARPTTLGEARRSGVDGKRKTFEPRFGGFMKRSPKKLSIDPIGRIRPAND